jgi:glycylpeptide N-tetradecanoyltransferase
MIKEITRRVNLNGIFQALYTAGTLLPEPVTIAQYFHRPLNYKKLCQTQFASLPSGKTMAQMEQRYAIDRENLISLRPIGLDDIPSAFNLFKTYMDQFKLTPVFDEVEFAHWVLPREHILKTYVREVDGKISGFASYYSLPTSVLSPDSSCPHDKISVAYLFYYAHDDQTDLTELIEATLAKAQDEGFDVFNCVEIMENGRFLDKLKFAAGDGNLHYYLFNWKAGLFESSEVAVVML